MKLTIENITPCIQCKNEEYWIHYVLRDPLKVFGKAIILDTGSTDLTKDIIWQTVEEVGGRVVLIQENYGNNANKIGNGRNVLRAECSTPYMFLIDGDEIYTEAVLHKMLTFEVSDKAEVIMLGSWNVEEVEGQLKLRTNDLANKDSLFTPTVRWTALDYPFEGYGLGAEYVDQGKAVYLPAPEVYSWHMRHTRRSSKNWEAYFRKDKMNYYPYKGPWEELPQDWLGQVNPLFPNPYLFAS